MTEVGRVGVEDDGEEELRDVVGGNQGAVLVGVASERSESRQSRESGGGKCRSRRSLVEQGANEGGVGWLLRSGDSLDAERAVGDAPVLDEAAEGVVGDESEVGEWGSGDGAGSVAGGDPRLDAGSIVGLASTNSDGVPHELQRNGASKVVRDLNSHVQWL